MSVYNIKVRDGKKFMLPVLNLEEYKKLRGSNKQLNNLKLARNGKEGGKRRLEQFNYSCLPNDDGTLRGATRVGNSVGMDIDHITNIKAIEEKVLSKKDEVGLLMMERSARGEGLHIVFRRKTDMNNEQNLQWASDLLGVEYDEGAKDITRVFFATSNDPSDLLYISPELFNNVQTGVEDNNVDNSDEANCYKETDSNIKSTSGRSKVNGAAENNSLNACALTSIPENIVNQFGSANPEEWAYEGILYKDILKRWWEINYGGHEPVFGNRQVRIFELASALRNICDFDRVIMDHVIPCYAGFDEKDKLKTIDQVIGEKRTGMPNKLNAVLASFYLDENADNTDGSKKGYVKSYRNTNGNSSEKYCNLDKGNTSDTADIEPTETNKLNRYTYDMLPPLPMGVQDSVDSAGRNLAMPILVAIAPAIGALATDVSLKIHGDTRALNLCAFIVGEFASGKGHVGEILGAWMKELQAQADVYTRQEEEWASKARSQKSGKIPEQPKFPVRMVTFNNTVANIAERLSNAGEKHCFSYTSEADTVALKWRQTMSDFSVMLRQAYDEDRYDREAKSAEAVRVHIEKLRWNVVMCGTQDSLYRVIPNYTNGLLSRLSIARTPDNSFEQLTENPARLTDLQSERIQQVAHLIPFMKGEVDLAKLEEQGRKWLEDVRMEALQNWDKVLAKLRMRNCVNAQRITVALTLPRIAEILIDKYGMSGAELRLQQDPMLWINMLESLQTPDMMKLFDMMNNYLLDNTLHYFRSRLEKAFMEDSLQLEPANRARKGRNDTIYLTLHDEFTFQDAKQLKLIEVGNIPSIDNMVQQMLKNWTIQGLIRNKVKGKYTKVREDVGA